MNSAKNSPGRTPSARSIPVIQRVIAILWPSFLVAGLATAVFFTVFDPLDLAALINRPDSSRTGIYSVGFFLFWILTVTSCALSCYFQRPCQRD